MLNLSNFLQKFAQIYASNNETKAKIALVVRKVCGVEIGTNFNLENGVMRLNVSPVMKSEIYMRKDKILSELVSLHLNINDIR
jgi:hypothetical protein